MLLPRSVFLLVRALALVFVFVLGLLAGPSTARADVPDDILQQVAALRGLQPKAAVPFAFVDQAKLRTDLLAAYEEAAAVREIEISRKLLVVLGLMSPDADLQGILLDLFASNVAGYYNRVDKTMYLVGGAVFDPAAKATLAHEFTHVLQDQYFDLEAARGPDDNSDVSLAVEALSEGDATLAMGIWARTYLSPNELIELQVSSQGSDAYERAPLVVRDEVTFPYNEGALFAYALWQRGGFEAVNAALRDPPRSSEQIMHPDKYLAREQPIEVRLPDLAGALGPGWSLLRTDVLGELDFRILLQEFVGQEVADSGAAGWGGDRFALLESATGDLVLVMDSVWDSDADAAEFAADYVELVRSRYGRRAVPIEELPTRRAWTTPNGLLRLERTGARVTVITAPSAGTLATLAAALGGAAPAPAGPRVPPAQVPR